MELCLLKEIRPVAKWVLQDKVECKDPQDRADKVGQVASRALPEPSSV